MRTAPHTANLNARIDEQIENLKRLQEKLLCVSSITDRLAILNDEPDVTTFIDLHPIVRSFIEEASVQQEYVLKAIIAIGQGPIVLNLPKQDIRYFPKLHHLCQDLVPLETFYDTIGGIVGYHLTVLRLLRHEDLGPFAHLDTVRYSKPQHINLQNLTPEVWQAIRHSLANSSTYAELYVVGGAGDRLDLRDSTTGEPLPAAKLRFQGRSLLEGLIRDLQAREYLHYKLFQKQVTTPIAMMTSEEKNNHQHMIEICKENHWFGRPSQSFFLFCQSGSPLVTAEGNWSLKEPLELTLKPGGHGVLWKLAEDRGVFDWLTAYQRSKILIRQINNPVAGTDYGILAFLGAGLMGNKAFGVASCDRIVNMPEGMSVLIETRSDTDFEYRLSNIEYTELSKRGIHDLPIDSTSEYSIFPANTNILFADLKTVREASHQCPLPGLLINMKGTAPFINTDWSVTQMPAGRLESTMQNIADYIIDRFEKPLAHDYQALLRTFATYNKRSKTLSVTKNSLHKGHSSIGTPEGCFYDVLCNYRELFADYCQWKMPRMCNREDSLAPPLPFVIDLHPALGPLYWIIGQKIRRGAMKKGSELRLEIAEVDIADLDLSGSLCVKSDNVFSHPDTSKVGIYSEQTGKCSLSNVIIRNKGIDYSYQGPYWRNDIHRHESLTIILHGNGEFHAENVKLVGDHVFEVADGERVVATAGPIGEVILHRTKIARPTWHWRYRFDNDNQIKLEIERQSE